MLFIRNDIAGMAIRTKRRGIEMQDQAYLAKRIAEEQAMIATSADAAAVAVHRELLHLYEAALAAAAAAEPGDDGAR